MQRYKVKIIKKLLLLVVRHLINIPIFVVFKQGMNIRHQFKY